MISFPNETLDRLGDYTSILGEFGQRLLRTE